MTRATCLLLAILLLPVPLWAGSRPLAPDSWGGKLSIGFDNRGDAGNTSGDAALGTGNPRFWFTESEDFIGFFNIWGKWKFRPFRRPSRIALEYERQQWVEGEILSRNLFTLELRQTLSERSRLELEVEHAPQVYLTHRLDKDALPGEPRFRPEAYRETEFGLAYRYAWTPSFSSTAFVTYTIRDDTRWFEERDRKRPGLGLALDLPLGPSAWVVPEYQFRVNNSRNEPDLGRDLSYREHVAELRVGKWSDRFFGPWYSEIRTVWKFRHYTTDDPEDIRRYQRNDQIYTWELKLKRSFGTLTPFLAWQAAGRWIDVPGDVESVDEDGDIDRTITQVGIEWEY